MRRPLHPMNAGAEGLCRGGPGEWRSQDQPIGPPLRAGTTT
jgi:hypothetical protein